MESEFSNHSTSFLSHAYTHLSWQSRMRVIYRATKQHALNLAKFVALYKTFLLVQRKANGGKQRSSDTFFAGLLGGYVVFGDRTAVNEQVCKRISSLC